MDLPSVAAPADSRDEQVQVLEDNYNKMPSAFTRYKDTFSFMPARSFFIPKGPDNGIGERLSPGKYKLLQG